MNLYDTLLRLPHPLVNLQDLGPEPVRLTGDSFSGELRIHCCGCCVVFLRQGRANWSHEH